MHTERVTEGTQDRQLDTADMTTASALQMFPGWKKGGGGSHWELLFRTALKRTFNLV